MSQIQKHLPTVAAIALTVAMTFAAVEGLLRQLEMGL